MTSLIPKDTVVWAVGGLAKDGAPKIITTGSRILRRKKRRLDAPGRFLDVVRYLGLDYLLERVNGGWVVLLRDSCLYGVMPAGADLPQTTGDISAATRFPGGPSSTLTATTRPAS
uniref:Uncharacterized protein n=1 Tax=Caulobacter phage BL57 TaxID=3348355 RepID=A0AB74UL12_9VIRU